MLCCGHITEQLKRWEEGDDASFRLRRVLRLRRKGRVECAGMMNTGREKKKEVMRWRRVVEVLGGLCT